MERVCRYVCGGHVSRAGEVRVNVTATPAMERGNAYVVQCQHCGVLAYIGVKLQVRALKACPACGRMMWRRVPTPVGPFKPTDDAA